MLESLGGTKFLLAIIAMAVAVAVHVLSAKGLTTELTTLLATLVGGFQLANAMITRKAIDAEGAVAVANEPITSGAVDLSPVLSSNQAVEAALVNLAQQATGLAKKEDLEGIAESLDKIAGMLANTNKLLTATIAARR
jgi:hypothetical protein